jgi:hypothetical protein
MRACHLRDGAAESEFLAWLEDELKDPKGRWQWQYNVIVCAVHGRIKCMDRMHVHNVRYTVQYSTSTFSPSLPSHPISTLYPSLSPLFLSIPPIPLSTFYSSLYSLSLSLLSVPLSTFYPSLYPLSLSIPPIPLSTFYPSLYPLSLSPPSFPLSTFFPSLYLTAEGVKLTEVYLDLKVTAFRAALSPTQFLEPSFPTIAGVNGNGAIVHYR